MPSLIHELDNDALLLMYAVGELPADDAAELEQLLTSDAGLAAGLAAVRADLAAAGAAMAAADHVDPPAASPSAESVALRRVGRSVRQWQAGRAVRARAAPTAGRQPRLPSWAYPAAAAAAVVIGAVSWWGLRGENSTPGGDAPGRGAEVASTDGGQPMMFPRAVPPMAADAFRGGTTGVDSDDLSDADRQARVLARADDAQAAPTIVRDGLLE